MRRNTPSLTFSKEKEERLPNVIEPKKLTVLKDVETGKLIVKKKGFECQHVSKGKCIKCFFTFRSLINVPKMES